MKKITLLAIATVLTLMSCSPLMVKSDFDPSANFGTYQTYAIRQDQLKLNDIDRGRVIDALVQQLQARGLQASSNPDLIVNVKASHKRIRDIQTSSPWGYGWGMGWGWGGPYGGMGFGYNRTYTDIYNRGALTLDFVDANTNKLVWQGIGNGLNIDNPKYKSQQIPEVIAKMLQDYPPKGNMGRRN